MSEVHTSAVMEHTETLPDGRTVELVDMTLAARDGDLWTIDVHLDVDGVMVTKRVEMIWSGTDGLPPVGI
jgi:hypothetical protein